MPSNVNVTLANFNPNTSPATASVDISATWIDDAGNPQSDTRVGVTIGTLWSALTAAQKRVVFQELVYRMVRLIRNLDNV